MELGTSLPSKAAHFLNPISDQPSNSKHPPSSSPADDAADEKVGSFSTFLTSVLVSSGAENSSNLEQKGEGETTEEETAAEGVIKGSRGIRRNLISKGKQSVARMISQAAHFTGYTRHATAGKSIEEVQYEDGSKSRCDRVGNEMKATTQMAADSGNLPACSEISMLLSERTRDSLYKSLPALVRGRNWVLLYSTWKHGISLSTLYRRSMLWPGLSLLVVGDRKGAVFGGLVEAPLRPSSMRKYQGSSTSFLFTNTSGHPVLYRPTGANRYFTVCSLDYIALGGGGHFALYLDQDLLTGSSGFSETYGNPCLSHTQDFGVKEVELWGFVYASKFDEVIKMSETVAPGICRW